MKKIASIFIVCTTLACASPLFAQDAPPGQSVQAGQKRDTIFNRCSDFFDTFNRPFKRPGNKQKIFTATNEWLRTIDKQ